MKEEVEERRGTSLSFPLRSINNCILTFSGSNSIDYLLSILSIYPVMKKQTDQKLNTVVEELARIEEANEVIYNEAISFPFKTVIYR